MANNRIIEWIPMYPDTVVWISVEKLDASWRQDAPYYVGESCKGPGNGDPSRYKKFGEWLTEGHRLWMPHIGFTGGHISFSDGRHRFAWLRDHGVRALPVTVSPDLETEVSRRFGTKRRISVLSLEKTVKMRAKSFSLPAKSHRVLVATAIHKSPVGS
jgi:hypothetical protein